MNVEFTVTNDYNFYVDEVLVGITDNLYDMHSHSIAKILFYNFNNYQAMVVEEVYKIRHTIISDDQFVLEKLQSKHWPYFVERIIKISEGNISPLEEVPRNENDFNELKIFNGSVDNLNICKELYRDFYTTVSFQFVDYLKSLPSHILQKTEDDLKINFFTFLDVKNDPNVEEIFHVFDQFYFKFGRFPGQNGFIIVPTGDLPWFIETENIISSIELYRKFTSKEVRGLVWVQFLAANVYLGGDSEISKGERSKFFHNLSMQALCRSDDRIQSKFTNTRKL